MSEGPTHIFPGVFDTDTLMMKNPRRKSLIGLPRRIRVARPEAVRDILAVLDRNTLKPIPKAVAIVINSIAACVADITLEILMIMGVVPALSFRLSYLFLVILAAIIGGFTLYGIRSRELDTTRSALILGFVVETGLFVSDLHFIFKSEPHMFLALYIRLFLVIGSFVNLVCVALIFSKLHLASNITRLLTKRMQAWAGGGHDLHCRGGI